MTSTLLRQSWSIVLAVKPFIKHFMQIVFVYKQINCKDFSKQVLCCECVLNDVVLKELIRPSDVISRNNLRD